MDPQVRDILVSLKTHVSEGWIQGDMQTDEGVCLYGALVKAGGMQAIWGVCGSNQVKGRTDSDYTPGPIWAMSEEDPGAKAMMLIAEEVGVQDVNELALWNDAEGRTVDDITNAIDRVLLKGVEKPKRNIIKRFFVKEKELVEA